MGQSVCIAVCLYRLGRLLLLLNVIAIIVMAVVAAALVGVDAIISAVAIADDVR